MAITKTYIFAFAASQKDLKLTHPCSLVPLPLLKTPTVFFFFFNSESHSVMESSSNDSHMEATQAQITCWYSKRRCYSNIWAFLANWQCVFCTWYLIWVEARLGVGLISWSFTIGVKLPAFVGVFWHFT